MCQSGGTKHLFALSNFTAMIGNIYITGQIGTFDDVTGVSLLDVVDQVKKQPDAVKFNVYINSEGGLRDTGMDIYNYLKALPQPKKTIGVRMVASIATVIFLAGDERELQDNTQFMIHNPWITIEGNAEELRLYSEELLKVEKDLASFYKKVLNIEDEVIQPLMRDESWLTVEQLTTLGFLTAAPVTITPKAYFKTIDKMNGFSEKDKHWMEGLFAKVLGKFKPEVKNKLVQDATGTEIDFGELEDDAAIEVGATATIDGAPAEGEYVMPDGSTYVFSAGELTEIRPEESEDEDVAALREENENLKEQLQAANTAKASAEKRLSDIEGEVKNLKSKVMSKMKIDTTKNKQRTPDGGDDDDRAAGIRAYLKDKKGK